MEGKKRSTNELLSRREFFKRGISKTLPVLVCAITPSYLMSCSKEETSEEDLLCNECSNSCAGSCQTTCSSTCTGNNNTSTNNGTSNGDNGGTNEALVSSASGKIDGYEYVDLGLSVKWARYNIGASKPEAYGTYLYAHTLCSDSYCYSKLINAGFFLENKSTSGTIYDMAISQWGNKWRMPTRADFRELINNCTITLITYNNHKGYLFKSKKMEKVSF